MPIYEYRCKECQHEVEALQKLSDPPLVTCPACGKPALQKLVSAAGFQLKGSGWYVTDFRGGAGGAKKAEKEAGKADAPAADVGEERNEDRSEERTKSESTTKSEPAAPAASTTSTTPVELVGKLASPMKRYLVAGLLVWVPLGITLWVLHFLVTTLDQTLLLFPESAQPDRLLGMHIPGFGVLLSFAILFLTGVIAANFFGARLIRVWESLLGPHPRRQVDLFVGQAGQRHAAFGFGQRVSQGAARPVPAPGLVEHRVPHRHAGARPSPSISTKST